MTTSVLAEPTSARSRLTLAGLLVVMGTLHFVMPRPFERLIPSWLGNPRVHVLWSGAAELLAGVLLAIPRTRRIGALCALATLVVVFPGNVKMALDAGPPRDAASVVAWARLPLQIPLWRWAWRLSR